MSALRHQPVQFRSETRLNQIKAAATILYNTPEVGRDRLTTAHVATLAGCSIATVYRYFQDRVALLDAIAPDRDNSPVVTA
jgi:AcrR family transcriptional regulator